MLCNIDTSKEIDANVHCEAECVAYVVIKIIEIAIILFIFIHAYIIISVSSYTSIYNLFIVDNLHMFN